MKKIILVLLVCLLFTVGGCSAEKKSMPEQTIKNYFIAYNDKNLPNLKSTLSEHFYNGDWHLNNIEYVKLLNLKELKDSNIEKGYLTNGRGKELKPAEVKVYEVEYDIKFKDVKKSVEGLNGKISKNFILIKQTKDSPWIISDMEL